MLADERAFGQAGTVSTVTRAASVSAWFMADPFLTWFFLLCVWTVDLPVRWKVKG